MAGVEGDKFEQLSLSNRTDTIEIEAARGEILDRDGNVLAGNRSSYNIVYDALDMDYSARNATIIQVLDLLEERGETWRDRLPIVLAEDGTYQYTEDSESAIATLAGVFGAGGVRHSGGLHDRPGPAVRLPGIFPGGRPQRGVRALLHDSGRLLPHQPLRHCRGRLRRDGGRHQRARPGVARHRDPGGCHPLLRGGRLFGPPCGGLYRRHHRRAVRAAVEDGNTYDAEDNISGYKWSDTMGRSGLEAAFEEELRGKRGEETIYTDGTGTVTSTAVTTAPEEGHTIQTTLDSDLQRVANLSLEKNIQSNTDARDATSGAVVVLDVDTFGVLACSSYPTYDVNQLVESIAGDGKYYNQLINDEDEPMVNLALNGVFTPGSVFKPVVALAALQEGQLSAATSVYCPGYYELADLRLGCTCGGGNTWNVYGALAHSCNTFFSTVGYDLGISTLDPYAEYFGLGTTTGVELGEATGIMSNPQEYRENHGVEWTDGVTSQTAIGQADNMFTPIQLAAMCATIANGGVRLQTHFLDKITDYTGETVIEEYQPAELYDAGISSDVLGVVQTGMQMVATQGTAADVFANYPVSIACKTGTAETSTPDENGNKPTEPNLSFICYAPADDPQIAIAVMMEYGNSGDYARNVAKDILDQYFGYYTWDEDGNKFDQNGNQVDDDGQIVKTAEEIAEEQAQQETSSQSGESQNQDASSAEEPTPAPTPVPDRGSDIPDTPYTGEDSSSSSQASSGADSGSGDSSGETSGGESGASPAPSGPYYSSG